MRARILVSILVLLGLMLAALVYYGHRFVEDSVFEQYLDLQVSTSTMTSSVFAKFLDYSIRDLQVLARDPDIMSLNDAGKAKLQGLPSSIGGLVGNVSRVGPDMRIEYTYPVSPAVVGKYVGDQPHNKLLLKTKKPVIGKPFMSVQGYMALPLCQPIFVNGRFEGSLTLLLRVDWLDQVFWKPLQRVDDGGMAALIDSQSIVFWSQGFPPVGTSLAQSSETSKEYTALSESLHSPEKAYPISLRTTLPGKPGKWVVAVTKIPLAGQGWYLISGISDEALTASIKTYRTIVLASGAIVVLLGLLVGMYLLETRKQFLAAEERARLADHFEEDLAHRTEELANAKLELEKHARNLELVVQQHTVRLRESEELYRQLVDNVTTIIFLLDKGKLNYANPAFLRSLKMPVETVSLYIGREFVSLVKPESRATLLSALSALTQGENAVEVAGLELLTADKDTRIWEGSVKRLETWKRDMFLCFFRDVTGQKHIEHQVLQSQKLESVGRLAGGIAHDFNNILAGIFGNLALLREQVGAANSDEDMRALFETIETAARRAADLTRKLLVFSRKESEDRKIVDLKHSIDEVAALIKTTLPRYVTFTQAVDKEPLRIIGNPTEIQQVLLNLCTNAIDSMPNGGKLQVIAARVKKEDEPASLPTPHAETGYARIRVVDTGTGISPQVIDNIFEPFFTTKETGKGTGLGLSIAYHIITTLGGTIEVDSDWGRGSVFTLYLPLAGDNVASAEPVKDYKYPDFARAKPILVVDDEEMITKPVQQFFGRHGLKALVAHDGVEAIDVFKEHQHEIGLVLIDLRMPRLTGAEAFSVIHQLNPSTTGILMTGFGEEMSNLDYLRIGFTEVLQKPFSFEDLSRVLERYLLAKG
jgi:PAS domain S-box-containing protein